MKKSHSAALERLFSQDIENALNKTDWVVQSKAKAFRELEADGYARRRTLVVGSGWSAVKIDGWELTLAGNAAYCLLCCAEDGLE